MTDVSDRASDVLQKAEAPPPTYPELSVKDNTDCFLFVLFFNLTTHIRVSSPVVPVPGVGQIGEGLQSTWGLEEDEEQEEESSGEEEVAKMEEEGQEKDKKTKGFCFFYQFKICTGKSCFEII